MDTETVRISSEVMCAIDDELAYQESMSSDNCRADEVDHGLPGQLLTLGVYTTKAQAAWTGADGTEKSLDELRKVAAIAIRALVRFGCPKRNPLRPV
jgi:hypothetical protein